MWRREVNLQKSVRISAIGHSSWPVELYRPWSVAETERRRGPCSSRNTPVEDRITRKAHGCSEAWVALASVSLQSHRVSTVATGQEEKGLVGKSKLFHENTVHLSKWWPSGMLHRILVAWAWVRLGGGRSCESSCQGKELGRIWALFKS